MMNYSKKQIFYFLITFFIFSTNLYADWNRDFDKNSNQLAQELTHLQNPDYIQQYDSFKKIRKGLVNDKVLIKQIQNADPGKKLILQKKDQNIIIKKRRNNHIHELYAWELSYLLGSNEFILPSFPVDLEGIRVIVQNMEPFEFGNIGGGGYSKDTLKRVSLETYWKAHIQAYILGLADLASANIGVNSNGIIRFFDTEASFSYYNIPFKTEFAFSTGFICQSFDWAQYRQPLDKKTVKEIRKYIQSFEDYEENLKTYLKYRTIFISEEGLKHRLERLRSFSIQEGTSFRDFIGWIYPKMSPGLDDLNQIVGGIMKRKVDHGTTLFFMGRLIKNYKLSTQEQTSVRKWVDKYID